MADEQTDLERRYGRVLDEWIALHGKRVTTHERADGASMSFGNLRYTVRKVTLTRNRLVGGGNLYLYAAFDQVGGYKSVLGYFCAQSGAAASCRHFYRSNSESAWRVGTGIRANTAWVKSAEGHASHMGSGYIMEGIVPRELEVALDTFQTDVLPPGDSVGTHPHIRQPSDDTTNWKRLIPRNFRSYFVNPGPGNPPSGIIDAYATERKYVSALAYTNAERARLGAPPIIEESYNVVLQERFSPRNKAILDKTKDNIAHQIKAILANENPDNPNLRILADLIQNPVDGDYYNPTNIPHSALGGPYNYNTYRFSPANTRGLIFHIEIAFTAESRSLIYQGLDGQEKTAVTPICWVRNAYTNSHVNTSGVTDLTSFGGFKYIPFDLAFLVQKPCDYVEQTSRDLVEAIGLKNNDYGRRGSLAPRQENTQAYRQHVFGSYIGLAVFNESTSYLIKLFKVAKSFPLFKGKYKVFEPEKDPQTLHRLVLAATDAYLNFQGADNRPDRLALFGREAIRGSHGQDGLNRAESFKNHLGAAGYDIQNTVPDVYALFARGKIGTRSVVGIIGNKIQANPYSLFTYVAKAIIVYYYEHIIEQHDRGTTGKYNASIKAAAQSMGSSRCIQRMLWVFLSNPQTMQRGLQLEEWVRNNGPALLEAFKK